MSRRAAGGNCRAVPTLPTAVSESNLGFGKFFRCIPFKVVLASCLLLTAIVPFMIHVCRVQGGHIISTLAVSKKNAATLNPLFSQSFAMNVSMYVHLSS
jgi:hypothetical protein